MPKASEQTLQAEHGLGIGGKPYYFYVLRAEESFGLVVFVLSEVEEADWPVDAKGATPFDSGGLWMGKIATRPELDEIGRRAFFQDQDVPLVDWRAAFENYVHTHYGTISGYLKGHAPGPVSKPEDFGVTIIRGSPNGKRAWTWEVRIPHDLITDRLRLRAVYMNGVSRDDYVDWLWRSPLADHESRQIHNWVENHVIVPKQGELAVRAVNDAIALGGADG